MKYLKMHGGRNPFVRKGTAKPGNGFVRTANKYGHIGKPGLILRKRK